jgi:hypothetical protein
LGDKSGGLLNARGRFAKLGWVYSPNKRRLLEPMGNIPPGEAEKRFYASLDCPALVEYVKPNSLRRTRSGSRGDLHADP